MTGILCLRWERERGEGGGRRGEGGGRGRGMERGWKEGVLGCMLSYTDPKAKYIHILYACM